MKRNRITGMMTACLFAAGMIFSSLPAFAATADAEENPHIAIKKTKIGIMFKKKTLARTSDDVTGILDASVEQYKEGVLTGTSRDGLSRVVVDGRVLFVDGSCYTSDEEDITALKEQKAEEERKAEEARKKAEEEKRKAEEEKKKAEEEKKKAEEAQKRAEEERKRAEEEAARQAERAAETAASSGWNGSVLSASAGVNYGPTGKETYYNLPMQGVVNIMRGMGYTGEYWVRADGAKMLGDYVMVAANLSVYPRGTLVPTSLGMGIVCDTGGFAAGNPHQLDIATAW